MLSTFATASGAFPFFLYCSVTGVPLCVPGMCLSRFMQKPTVPSWNVIFPLESPFCCPSANVESRLSNVTLSVSLPTAVALGLVPITDRQIAVTARSAAISMLPRAFLRLVIWWLNGIVIASPKPVVL